MEEKVKLQQISKDSVSEIVVDFLKKKKETDKIDIAMIEKQTDGWIVRGTCPIDLEGHKWAEGFTVSLDLKGKIKNIDFSLL
ncbi:MAG: hypothetical protein KGD70_14865 [Candidatus Lokiarchaeota archaeon]|nr:hypothetical protein [Candidatus Lokiarchaeota archaeon]